ncbi:MAG: M18 family aminopeptidase [Proteobacteria bacterium]|nr:M18 family aminopeptidase [Pseudomonadota bacterium]
MISRLFDFLEESPVSFHAIAAMEKRLKAAGYRKLDAADRMSGIAPGSRIYVTKNDTSLFAFHIGSRPLAETGIRLICAHSDSPTFRIKPQPEILGAGRLCKLNVEVYGGAILSTWMDRPLGIAGRVVVRTADPMKPESRLMHIRRPLLTIPSLCIHFNRQVNSGVALSVQKDMQPILGYIENELSADRYLIGLVSREIGVDADDILDFDLYLYSTEKPCCFGAHDEFISASRLDDLSMVHAGLESLLASDGDAVFTRAFAVFDNEETGSGTKQGAGSPFFASVVKRLILATGGDDEDYYCTVERSFMISADNAHAYHPNYSEKYDPVCRPILGAGPAIKYNAAQKYASDAWSASVFEGLCRAAGVQCQRFVNHSDVAGGSTLGNILTGSFPVAGVDMGNPILAMHSVRETGSVSDHVQCFKAFAKFYGGGDGV